MTFQEAANKIITEAGKPLSPNKVAYIAFAGGLVKSRAKDPIRSFAETIKNNTRENLYNRPPLFFIKNSKKETIAIFCI